MDRYTNEFSATKAKTHQINTQLYKLKDEIKKLITN